MNKVHKFTINDEPFVDTSTGVREATLIYKGGRYVYAEVCTETNKIQAPVHMSDTPDMETAQDRRTEMDTRVIGEIDADTNPIAAAIIIDSFYHIEIPTYVEELPDGTTYTNEYPDTCKLNEVYDITNMTFDIEAKDFNYKFNSATVTDEEFIESIDAQLTHVENCLEENSYTEDQLTSIEEFKLQLIALKDSYDGSVKHWKIGFPTCSEL
jgi:hypothetical protein